MHSMQTHHRASLTVGIHKTHTDNTMSRKSQYTPEQRRSAVELHKTHGPAEAARITGIPKPTIASWARRDGVQPLQGPPPNLVAAVEAMKLTNAQKRETLAAGLLDDALKLRAQLFEPVVEAKIVTLSGGMNSVGTWEPAYIDLDQPRFSEQLMIVKTVETAAKTANLLTGEATSRPDVRDVEAVRLKMTEKMDELAARRRTG